MEIKKNKEPEKSEDNLFNSREIGTFTVNVPLKTDEYLIKNEQPKINQAKGLIIIEYKLEEKSTEVEFGENSENEV